MPELKHATLIYRGFLFELRKEFWQENGRILERDVVDHRGAVCILPVYRDSQVILIKQYRHAVRQYLLEVPAGLLEQDESPEQTAIRELEEEIGGQVKKIRSLGRFFTSPGYTNEVFHFFQADISAFGEQNLEEDEILEVVPVSIDEFYRMIDSGTIKDAKTVIAGALWKWKTNV